MHPHTSNLSDILNHVARLLDSGQAGEALDFLRATKSEAIELRNATGVALMRLGRAEAAVELFRKLTTNDSGLFLRKEAPIEIKVNYATALILAGNVTGALVVLDEINDDRHPGVGRLRNAIARWRTSLSFGQRLWMAISGCNPNRPVELDAAPGTLMTYTPRRPVRRAA